MQTEGIRPKASTRDGQSHLMQTEGIHPKASTRDRQSHLMQTRWIHSKASTRDGQSEDIEASHHCMAMDSCHCIRSIHYAISYEAIAA